jgi:hypothetical protein
MTRQQDLQITPHQKMQGLRPLGCCIREGVRGGGLMRRQDYKSEGKKKAARLKKIPLTKKGKASRFVLLYKGGGGVTITVRSLVVVALAHYNDYHTHLCIYQFIAKQSHRRYNVMFKHNIRVRVWGRVRVWVRVCAPRPLCPFACHFAPLPLCPFVPFAPLPPLPPLSLCPFAPLPH